MGTAADIGFYSRLKGFHANRGVVEIGNGFRQFICRIFCQQAFKPPERLAAPVEILRLSYLIIGGGPSNKR